MRCRLLKPVPLKPEATFRAPNLACLSAGFSLLELLLVAALLLILSTMYWGSLSGKRQRTQLELCQSNLQKLFIAMQIYANDFTERFPEHKNARTSEEALDILVPRYSSDTSIFICPSSGNRPLPAGEPFRNRTISYAYYMGRHKTDNPEVLMSDRQINNLSKHSGDPVFSSSGKPPGNNHDRSGGNYLFCDGRTESSPPQTTVSLVLTQGVVLLNPRP